MRSKQAECVSSPRKFSLLAPLFDQAYIGPIDMAGAAAMNIIVVRC